MKRCLCCHKEKSLGEFSPHRTTADGYNPKCKFCISEYNRGYRLRNQQRIKENDKEYAANNREAARNRSSKWRKDNPEWKQQNDKEYYKKNRDRELQKSKSYYQKNKEHIKQKAKEYRENNRGKVNANIAKRRAAEKQATPAWANFSEMERLYVKARTLTETKEAPYQVDHIVPLTSDVVCGLHCEDNLQILTAEENNKKNNTLLK